MRHQWLALGLWLTLAAAGCASHTNLDNYRSKDPDEAMIVASLMRIPNGIKARSVDLMLQPYADDVYVGNFQKYLGVATPTAPLSLSKPDLRDAYTQVFRAAKDLSMDVKDVQIMLNGDRATVEARTELLYKFEAGRGESKQGDLFRNDVIWRMRRTPNGWKIVEEIWQ